MNQQPAANNPAPNHPVVVGISGASGSAIANGVIETLLKMERPVYRHCIVGSAHGLAAGDGLLVR